MPYGHVLRLTCLTREFRRRSSKKICGWTEEKVMTRYIRLAGLDVSGATDSLSFSDPYVNVGAKKVVNLRDALTENPLNPKNGKE